VDKECNVCVPGADRNCHGNSVPIPDGDSTETQSYRVLFACAVKIENIDARAKYDQSRRGCEGQVGKYLPTSSQTSFFFSKRWLTDSKIIHSFAEASSISSNIGGTGGYDTYLTVDRTGGIECDHVQDYGNEGAHACQKINLPGDVINTTLWIPVQRD
jgi:hypothetical protein